MKSVKVFAPATVANVAVGFDLLGFPIEGVGDIVSVSLTKESGVHLKSVSGSKKIPTDARKNTATVGLFEFISDLKLDAGFEVSIEKGIPLSSGMGGSAASAVGAVVAANALLSKPLKKNELLRYALCGEEAASGTAHADNITPCLFGGLTLAAETGKMPTVIPVPKKIFCVLVHPDLELSTKKARSVLKGDVSIDNHVKQSANLANFISGCYESDFERIRSCMQDILIEPQRKYLIPGFDSVKSAALQAGALGCSISGAGPSLFAWAPSRSSAKQIERAMNAAFQTCGVKTDSWVSPISLRGARIIA